MNANWPASSYKVESQEFPLTIGLHWINCNTQLPFVRFTALGRLLIPYLPPNCLPEPIMVYQGKPSAGCAMCRQRKIKVRQGKTCTAMQCIASVDMLYFSATNFDQPALNV